MKTNLLKSIFISLILLVGATNAWAGPTFGGGCVYFHNKGGWNDSYKYICISHDSWTEPRSVTVITNTQLWYNALPTSGWTDAKYMSAMGHSSSKSASNFKVSSCNHYTKNVSLGDWGFNNGNAQMLTPANGNNNAALELTYMGNSYDSMNRTITVKAKVSTDNGSSFAEATSPGTLSASSFAFTSYTSCKSAKTLSSGKITCGYTANTTLTAVAATGYTFAGWYDASGNKQTEELTLSLNPTADATYYAYYKANQYTVTLNASDGTGGTASVTATYGADMPAITKPTRNGYTFKGYYDATSGGTQYYKADGTSARIWNKTAATTLYAQWDLATYTITYSNLKGATHTNPATYTINSATITFTAPTSKPAGYTFANWSPTSIATGSTGNKTVTANWTAATSTVELNQEEATEKGTTSVTATYGSAMPAITKLPIRTGYTFGGYYTGKNGAGTQYYKADGTSATTWNLEGAQTLYAKWTAIKYNITYTNLGGATHTNANKYTIEDAITFSKPSTRNGYTFAGWYPASIEKGSTGDKTITAQWTEKPANTVYFKPQSWWKDNNARTAIWAWKENGNPAVEGWVDVDYDDCIGNILRAEIPAKYDRIKFVRLKPSSADGYNGENNGYHWGNEWNSTETLTVPTDNKNLYDMTVSANSHLFFQSNSNWTTDGARTAAYFFGNGEKWVSMTDKGDGLYFCEKPSGYTKVIFVRMDGANQTNNWNNDWNQTADLTLPTDGKNLYTINGALNNLSGTWSTGADNVFDSHRWTTYTAPTFDVTISAATNGTIKVAYNGQTYTSGQTISNVPIHTELNVTFTPATGYVLTNPQVTYADQIAEGVYSICGPSVISAAFTPRGETRVIYLRPNDDWLHDDAIFVAHAWNGDGNSDYVLTTKDNDYTGSYSCTIDSKYDHILFARLDPADKGNINLENAWNKTKDLEIVESIYTTNNQTRFAIGDKDGDRYDGAWEKNTPIWGLTADFNSWRAEEAIFRGYPGKVDILLHSGTHEFLLYNIKTQTWFYNNGTYTRGNSDQWWTMDGNTQDNCKLVADVDNAIYHFQMQYVTQVGEFKNQISITYPSTEVYYLAYQEGDNTKSFRKSHAIDKITEGEKQDTISFFVNVDNTPYLYLLDYAGNVLAKHFITSTGGADPNNAMLPSKRNSNATLYVGAGCGVENNGVYNFILLQEGNEAQIDAAATHLYTGSYYIRTDVAKGGWNAYKQVGNKMTYTSYADNQDFNFNHYFVEWINQGTNVKFTIANDYSYCLSDTLDADDIVTTGNLPKNANVRFGWNSKTNELSRAYISGSAEAKDRFLVLEGNEYLKDINGNALNVSGLDANEAIFSDKQNWIYQLDVQANSNTEITLTAQYNGKVQTFFGTSKSGFGGEPIMQATNDDYHKVRMIYDFKTNNLIAAWLLDETQYPEATSVTSNMLIIRENQGDANQINFSKIDNADMTIQTAYAVMTFTKDWVTGADTRDRSEYWVSFPFNVKISDVFGFSEYGDQWIMQLYDGDERAEKGNWVDSPTFWKYITNRNYTLKAGVGYVLKLNPSKMTFDHGVNDVSLFFPSQGIPTVINAEPTPIEVPAHTCTIERDNRNIYDSHWNLIGVPGYANLDNLKVGTLNQNVTIENEARNLAFYYAYDAANNDYNTELATATFKNMYAYMVQYAGELAWTNIQETPASIAARHNSDAEPEKRTLRLEIAQGEEVADQTFVQLQQEGATPEFDMNLDLTKIINSGANIYTLAGDARIQVAGNALPIAETTIPVGVQIAKAGEYTFAMPDGTDGIIVELIDYETNTRTNLLLSDYTTTLPQGICENRFALSVKPDKVATDVEHIGEGVKNSEAAKKYIIDGKLYLQKDGMLYDAQGHIVR